MPPEMTLHLMGKFRYRLQQYKANSSGEIIFYLGNNEIIFLIAVSLFFYQPLKCGWNFRHIQYS